MIPCVENQTTTVDTCSVPHHAQGKYMKQRAMVLLLLVIITLLYSGCGIPDLPGPLGIPGL